MMITTLAALAAAGIGLALSRRNTGLWPTVAASFGGFMMLTFLLGSIRAIPAGHVAVVDLFGSVSPQPLPSGLRLVNPFASTIAMSVKTLENKEEVSAPTREGLTVGIEISVLFHLDPLHASDVYREVGPKWVDVLLIPQFRSVVRGVSATYEAKALYTSGRQEVADRIAAELAPLLAERGVIIETTALRKLTLPAGLQASIEQKLEAEQESQRMQFVLSREKQEAERKRIEAEGIATSQRIVAQGLTEPVLRYRGIEATLKLAESPNTKVVVVGGKDGLPLILGDHR
ncbi:MAG: prohibitin family protein [Vicinamibacteria bacterium]